MTPAGTVQGINSPTVNNIKLLCSGGRNHTRSGQDLDLLKPPGHCVKLLSSVIHCHSALSDNSNPTKLPGMEKKSLRTPSKPHSANQSGLDPESLGHEGTLALSITSSTQMSEASVQQCSSRPAAHLLTHTSLSGSQSPPTPPQTLPPSHHPLVV